MKIMKKIMNFALIAATVCCLSLAVTSCKDDDKNNGNGSENTPEAVDDQTSLEEYQLQSVIANFAGIDAADVVLTKSYEPEIGVVDDASKPNVRSIAVGTIGKADTTAVLLLSALGIDAASPAGFSYSSDLVGSANYQHGGGDANTLATINLALKQMPGLVQLRLTKTAGENANTLPRYKVGDIVKYKNHYWVCVYEAPGYKGNAYFMTFDHTGDLHATSTFMWTPSWSDKYWQYSTPMADATMLSLWLINCVLNDNGWEKVKSNYRYAVNHKEGFQLKEEYLEQMVPTSIDQRKDFIYKIYKANTDTDKKFVTYMVSKSQTNLDYANDDDDVWEDYDNGKGHLKAPTELLCNTTRYSENMRSNNQFWVPYLFLCPTTQAKAFDDYLNAIPSQNTKKFTHEMLHPTLQFNSQQLQEKLGTNQVAIMTAARYWEHEYFDGNNWLLFDFTKDWRNFPNTEFTASDVWISRCVTSKSMSIVDKGVTASGFTDVYVAREDDLDNVGSYDYADLETPFEGEPYYKFSDVYQDENGHRWFVINNAGFYNTGFGDKGFYSELISFDGLTPSADKGTITNLPTRDQAIRAAVWLWCFFNESVPFKVADRNNINSGKMTGLGYSVFNIYDNCDFDIRMLLQQVRSHKPEFDVREPNHLMSIAYRDPNDTSGKQRLLRFVKNSANDQKHTTFYLWDTYVNNPDSITEAYETYAYGPSNIYLQDIADQNLVDLYAKDYYAVQPLYSKDSWEDKTNNPARNYRTAADAAAKDVTNYLYNRDKWHNRTFPTDMWNSPVVMFRMTAVYDRGPKDYTTKTVDGLTLTPLKSRPWIDEYNENLYEEISRTLAIWHSNEVGIYVNGNKTDMPSRKDVWKK